MVKFLSRYITWNPGPIVLPDGQNVGRHRGLQFYTIGQRRGFGADVDQARMATFVTAGQPLFVAEKILSTNTLVVAPADQPDSLSTQEFTVTEPHWIRNACVFPWLGTAKLRYRQPNVPITLLPEGDRLRVICLEPQRAVTPGQYAVFYQDDECLGCGVIDTVAS